MPLYDDGSSTAPVGTPEIASLLSAYSIRPPWAVAGVDYRAGVPSSGAGLKNPSTISMAGVSVDTASHIVNVTGSNVTLSGYDFSASGGWQVVVNNGATNVTIANSYFKGGGANKNIVDADHGGYVNLIGNTIDGGGASSSVNSLFYTGAGATIEYNNFMNVPNDAIDITHDGSFTIKYNLFQNLNYGKSSHSDAIQTYFSDVSHLDIEFNTLNQNITSASGEMNSFVRIGDEHGHTVLNPVIAYNTLIFKGSVKSSAITQLTADDGYSGSKLLNPSVHDNYVDPTGLEYAAWWFANATNPMTYGNVNMKAGVNSHLLVGPYNSWTSGIPAAAPSVPKITSGHFVNGDEAALSGTAPAGAMVGIFGPVGLIGSVKAGSNGTWSFTSGHLGAGVDGFTVRATDSLGNTSAASPVLTLGAVTAPPPAGNPAFSIGLASDTGASSSDGVTSNAALSGFASPGAAVKLTIDGKPLSAAIIADGSGKWSFVPSGIANGQHTVVATESPGSVTASKSIVFSLDTVAPKMSVALAHDTGASPSDKITSDDALTGSGDPGATVHFTIDGRAIASTVTADRAGHWTFLPQGLAHGQHVVAATETDLAGNTGTASVTFTNLGTTPRVTGHLAHDTGTSSSDGITSKAGLTGTATPGSVVHLNIDGKDSGIAVMAHPDGSWTFRPKHLADGVHTVVASERDSHGNSDAATLTFTLDRLHPKMPIALADDAGALHPDHVTTTGTVSGGGEPGATIHFRIDHHDIAQTAVVDSSGAWSFTPTGLTDGRHKVVAFETDAAGNTGYASLRFMLDSSTALNFEKLAATGSDASGHPLVAKDATPSSAFTDHNKWWDSHAGHDLDLSMLFNLDAQHDVAHHVLS